jgi:hypothetical protein
MLRAVAVSISELEKEGKPSPYFVMLQKPRTRHAARSRTTLRHAARSRTTLRYAARSRSTHKRIRKVRRNISILC